MRATKRVIGTIIVSAPVDATQAEAHLPDSAHRSIQLSVAQIRRAVRAFGSLDLSHDFRFRPAGIELNVLDASGEQNAAFDHAAFEAFVRCAHDSCSAALDAPGETSEQLASAAEAFAEDEGRDVDAIKALFGSMAAHPGTAILSKDGELIDLGVGSQHEDDHHADMQIDVACVRYVVRIKTTQGQYDVSAELAEKLRVGQHICLDEVEPPTSAMCIRADSIDVGADPTSELFGDSVNAEPDGDPDDGE